MSDLRPTFQKDPVDTPPLCTCTAPADAPKHGARRWLDSGWLLLWWLLHGAVNFWWLKVDTRPPYSDMAGHAMTTLRLASWPWRQWVIEGRILHELLNVNPYPPFFYLTTLPFVWFVWPTVDAMLAVNVLYLGLLIFSTYGIGRLAVGRRAGLLAAFLVSMYPLIYGLSRQYLADVALTSVTTFAIFCLFWSRAFARRWPSLLLGITIGVGVLTKWTFIVFLVGPLLIALYATLRHATRARLINVALAGLLSLAIGLPWYLNNLDSLQAFLDFNRLLAAPQEGEAPIWSVESWIYYLRELLNQQVLLPFALLAALGTFLALRRCRMNSYLWMLVSWIAVGYIASTLFINKDTRYTMPYLPSLALLSAIGFVQIRSVMVQRIGLVLIVLYALLQYAGLTVGLSSRLTMLPARIGWTLGVMPLTLYAEGVHIADPARSENWQIDTILNAALADAAAQGAELPIEVLMVPSMNSFDAQAFMYTKWRDRLPIEVSLVTGIVKVDSENALERSDYVVTKSGDLGWDFVLQDARALTAALDDPHSPLSAKFELFAEFPLPDHSFARLYRHLHQD